MTRPQLPASGALSDPGAHTAGQVGAIRIPTLLVSSPAAASLLQRRAMNRRAAPGMGVWS